MCEANAYVVRAGNEDLILEDITVVRQEDGELFLKNMFGEEKRIKARFKEMNLTNHRVILEAF
jgi:predicted RNA-binding protein